MNWWTACGEAADLLRQQLGDLPKTAVVLGSGWKSLVSSLEIEKSIELSSISHFPRVRVEGHGSQICIGKLAGKRVLVVQGRSHLYEGHTPEEAVRVVRTLARGGVENFVLTNAAGCLRGEWKIPTLMLIQDHINALGCSPLTGPNVAEAGPRFPDMGAVYSADLRSKFVSLAKANGVSVCEGVYLAAPGPAYETPAEVRMYRAWGGDAVGMSTVPEAIALAHLGKKVLGVSCLTNYGAGLTASVLNHQEVLEEAAKVVSSFETVFRLWLSQEG